MLWLIKVTILGAPNFGIRTGQSADHIDGSFLSDFVILAVFSALLHALDVAYSSP